MGVPNLISAVGSTLHLQKASYNPVLNQFSRKGVIYKYFIFLDAIFNGNSF